MSNDFLLHPGVRGGDRGLGLTPLSGGGFVGVWSTLGSGFEAFGDVVFRVFDADGTAVGPRRTAGAADTRWNQSAVAAVATPDGGFLLAWSSEGASLGNPGDDPRNFNTFVQRHDALGNPVGPQVQVTSELASGFDQLLQDIDITASGGVRIITAASNVRTDWVVTAWRFDAALNPLGSAVVDDFAPTGLAAAFRTLTPGWKAFERADGSYVATWWEQPHRIDPITGNLEPFAAGDQILSRVFAADGTPISPVREVSPLRVLTGGVFPPDAQFPSIVELDGGRYVIGWTEETGEDFRDLDPWVRTYAADGTPLTGPVRVNLDSEPAPRREQSLGDILPLPGLGFLVTYESFERREDFEDLTGAWGRLFDLSGLPLGGTFRLSQFLYDDMSALDTVRLGGGSLLLGWSGGGAASERVYGNLYRADGAFVLATAPGTFVAAAGGGLLIGSAGADVLVGSAARDVLFGGLGDDVLLGGAEFDEVSGGAGLDLVDGGAGGDAMEGGAGNDVFRVDSLADTVFEAPGEGDDAAFVTVSGWTAGPGLEVVYLSAVATALAGSAGADQLVANPGIGSTLDGGAGDDTLWGGAQADTLRGGVGNDLLRSQGGADLMEGGIGDDQFTIFDAAARVAEEAGGGTDTAWVAVDGWTMGTNIEFARLVGAATRLTGSATGEVLVANQAVAAGQALDGAGGDDVLWGTAGAETMRGGAGNDVHAGLGGADVFVFDAPGWGSDVVAGFDGASGARLDLRGSGLSLAQLVVVSGADTRVVAPDGSSIYLVGVASLGAGEFLF